MVSKMETNFNSPQINIGINDEGRKDISEVLSKVLADTYLLGLKTQNYHWNVTGSMFKSLHALFDEQYSDIQEAADLIAERIRALGEYAPGSFAEFSKLTSITEETGVPTSNDMIQNLVISNETVIKGLREAIKKCEEYGDDATEDIMITRIQEHEKHTWMLRSLITSQRPASTGH